MPINSDIYLLLSQTHAGAYKKVEGNKAMALMLLKKLIAAMVIGDSLDAPFLGFIRVQGVKHDIALGKDTKPLEWEVGADEKLDTDDEKLRGRQEKVIKFRAPTPEMQARIDAAYDKAIGEQRNKFATSHLPDQNAFEFTKFIDCATPQLAYACSVQAKFPLAMFFFRKKVGLGLGGVRIPYLNIALRKVRITGYSVADDKETIKLQYGDIAWAALGQVGDSNLPFPVVSARMYDAEGKRGSEWNESGWAYLVQAIGAAMSLIAGGVSKGTGGGGDYEG